MRIAAFDLATLSGWCGDDPNGGNRPKFGSFRISHDGDYLGDAYVQFEHHILKTFDIIKPEAVGFEAPLPRGAKGFKIREDSAAATRKILGLAAIFELVATRAGLDVIECLPNEARATMLRGDADKGDVMQLCRMLGWTPGNLDESDSAAVFVHLKRHLDPDWWRWFCGQSLKATPMFARVPA